MERRRQVVNDEGDGMKDNVFCKGTVSPLEIDASTASGELSLWAGNGS